MKAVVDSIPADGTGWVYEVKWDGMRAVAVSNSETVQAASANLLDITPRFPELASVTAATGGRSVALDGELVCLDETGRPSFSTLQQRIQTSKPAKAAELARRLPVIYMVFDILHLDGFDLTPVDFAHRRILLADVLDETGPVRLSQMHTDGGAELLEACRQNGLEGVMAKRVDAPYEPGKRSAHWRKVKVRRRQEFVVGGWTDGQGGRSGRLGSLIVGYHDPSGALRCAGRVGSGLTQAETDRLARVLGPLRRDSPPFDPAPADLGHWVEPKVVIDAEFAEWTPDDRLRHPVYIGQRHDVDPIDVRREPDPGPVV